MFTVVSVCQQKKSDMECISVRDLWIKALPHIDGKGSIQRVFLFLRSNRLFGIMFPLYSPIETGKMLMNNKRSELNNIKKVPEVFTAQYRRHKNFVSFKNWESPIPNVKHSKNSEKIQQLIIYFHLVLIKRSL